MASVLVATLEMNLFREHVMLIAIAMSTAIAVLAAPLTPQDISWDELHKSSQRDLNKHAENYVIIDGELFSTILMDEVERIRERGGKDRRKEQLNAQEAPLVYSCKTGQRYKSIDDARVAKVMNKAKGRKLMWLSGEVIQVLEKGAIVQMGDTTVYVQGEDVAYVDGEEMEGFFQLNGRHIYHNVLGARRTVLELKPTDIPPVEFNDDVSGEELLARMKDHKIDTLPHFSPRRIIDQPRKVKATLEGSTVTQKEIYHWEWEVHPKKVRLIPADAKAFREKQQSQK